MTWLCLIIGYPWVPNVAHIPRMRRLQDDDGGTIEVTGEENVQRVAACAAKKPLAFLQGKFLKHKMDDTAKVWLAKL